MRALPLGQACKSLQQKIAIRQSLLFAGLPTTATRHLGKESEKRNAIQGSLINRATGCAGNMANQHQLTIQSQRTHSSAVVFRGKDLSLSGKFVDCSGSLQVCGEHLELHTTALPPTCCEWFSHHEHGDGCQCPHVSEASYSWDRN